MEHFARNAPWGHTRIRLAQISHFVTHALQVRSHDVPFLSVFEEAWLGRHALISVYQIGITCPTATLPWRS